MAECRWQCNSIALCLIKDALAPFHNSDNAHKRIQGLKARPLGKISESSSRFVKLSSVVGVPVQTCKAFIEQHFSKEQAAQNSINRGTGDARRGVRLVPVQKPVFQMSTRSITPGAHVVPARNPLYQMSTPYRGSGFQGEGVTDDWLRVL
eukprot:1697649-Amphidinium_carterae.1